MIHVANCSTKGKIRLVGGKTESEGTVELCSGVWGTVCGDYWWNDHDAKVTCRQLGYPAASIYNKEIQ